MTTNSLSLIAPAYRSDPLAAEFHAVLEQHLPEWARDLRDYAWDTEIPPRDRWEDEAEKLAEHLESLS